jgi:tripeptidyl-peptidase-1
MKLAAVVLALCVAMAAARVFEVFESEKHVPEGWSVVGPTTQDFAIEFKVGLNTYNMDILERELMKASDPKDAAHYGKWWSVQQIHDLVAPSLDDQMKVQQWLEKFDMKVSRHGDYQIVRGQISAIEKMLDTKFYTFSNIKGEKLHRIMRYTVPDSVSHLVTLVGGLSGFPVKHDVPRAVADDSKGKVVPETLWQLYNIPYTQEVVYLNSSVCLVEFQNAHSFAIADLTDFESQTLLPDVIPDHIVGPFVQTNPNTESSLDVQYAIAISQNTSTWFWTSTGWLYDWTTSFLATDPVPYVVSMSWGWTETDQCSAGNCYGMTSEQYTNTVNNQLMQIAMRGVTILASSGDRGAPGDGDRRCKNTAAPLSSIFPGASPWVLSIGATMLTDPSSSDPPVTYKSPICRSFDCSTSRTEKVCSYPDALITTGGGFSTYLPQPSYQTKVVSAYLNSGVALPPSWAYNSTNRGFPDVSALGHNYIVEQDAKYYLVDGTSASSPVWAGIIGRLNAYRLNKGLPSLGFINPLIYQMQADQASTFRPLSSGNNDCTEGCCGQGYNAGPNWDPVTGLGTPSYDKIWAYVTALKN